jgi:hypothetical protein
MTIFSNEWCVFIELLFDDFFPELVELLVVCNERSVSKRYYLSSFSFGDHVPTIGLGSGHLARYIGRGFTAGRCSCV